MNEEIAVHYRNWKKETEKMKNKYITVLDFEVNRVFQYKIDKANWCPLYEWVDEFIINKGHRLSNCEWMVHDIAGIIKNNDGSYGKL